MQNQNLYQLSKNIVKFLIRPIYNLKRLTKDFRALLGFRFGETNIIFVAGYPKSGTTWVENFISNIPGYNARELNGNPEIISQQNLPEDSFKWFPKWGYSSIKTHTNPNEENLAILRKQKITKILIMYRDPRDIVVSNYHHVRKKNPWDKLNKIYLDYNTVSQAEGLSHSLQVVIDTFSSWVNGWLILAEQNKDIEFYFLSYEELRKNPENEFNNIVEFFGLYISSEKVLKILNQISKRSKKFNPSKSLLGFNSTYRKGMSGEWKHVLNEDQKAIANREFKPILLKLGYRL